MGWKGHKAPLCPARLQPRKMSTRQPSEEEGNTVIVGAGIIGLCTAYYLSTSGRTKPQSIHLVDSSADLFRCASGFAGGFQAADCMLLDQSL